VIAEELKQNVIDLEGHDLVVVEFAIPTLTTRPVCISRRLVQDEYDVQDILKALLRVHFNDVRPEEPNPSIAGQSPRVDFWSCLK
jgi:hypothetical protein